MGTRSLVTPKLSVSLSATVKNVLDDGQIAQATIAANITAAIANGVEAGQADRGWQWKSKTLAAGQSITLDLIDFTGFDNGAGDGCDAVGQFLTLYEIVTILVMNENAVTSAGRLSITTVGVSDPWSQLGEQTGSNSLGGQSFILKHKPDDDGMLIKKANRNVKLTASGAAVTYSIWLLGRSDTEASSSSSECSSSGSSSSSISTSSQSSSSISTSSSSSSLSSISTSSSSSSSSSSTSSQSSSSTSSSCSSSSSISTSSSSSSSSSTSSSS